MRKIFAKTTSSMFLTDWDNWQASLYLCQLNGGNLLSDITHSQWTQIQMYIKMVNGIYSDAPRSKSVWLGGTINEEGDLIWSQSDRTISNVSFRGHQFVKGNCLLGSSRDLTLRLQPCSQHLIAICVIQDQVQPKYCETDNDCPANASCIFPIDDPNRKACICDNGFEKKGPNCRDIDECYLYMDDCQSDATCENTVGSYQCTCNERFFGNGKVECFPFENTTIFNDSTQYFESHDTFASCFQADERCKSAGGRLVSFETHEEWVFFQHNTSYTR